MSPPVRLAVVVLVLLQVYQCAVPQQKRAATENATRPTLVPSAQNEANSKGDQEKRPTTAQKHKNTAMKTLENTHTQLIKTLKTTLAETTPSLKVPQVKRVMKKMTLQPTTSKSTAKKPTTLQPTRKPAAKKITPKKSVNEFPLNEIFYKGRETSEYVGLPVQWQ